MSTYEYSRELVNGAYNINNLERIDGESNQIRLFKEVLDEGSLPDAFEIICNETLCTFIFSSDLTGQQETTLNNIVSDHKNNI